MPRIDPFFDKQPPLEFINELRRPMYTLPPLDWGSRPIAPGEIDASGMYLASECPNALLETAWASLRTFLNVYRIGGTRFPVTVTRIAADKPESFRAEITADGVQITGDTEGIRRALIWLEDSLRRAEGPYLTPGVTERHAVIRSRITRCFFSPINRPPKFGDELSDDIDYYPDEYLNRLMHDGANGVWIYTRFSDLMESSFVPSWGKNADSRIAKLNRVIEKCARYGIGVYVFAIEPTAMPEADFAASPALAGVNSYNGRCICIESEEGRAFLRESGRRLFERAPGLRGFISITFGERPTACSSVYPNRPCPKGTCPAASHGCLLADNVAALRAGMREASPDCEVISWTYGHRTWSFDDIREYVAHAPLDVMLMQNFDDMGYEEQLGVMRQCVDYWLSYVGPSELFTITADAAKAAGRQMFAKMQVCCSHELATVPYIPVPGILYKKYAAARAYGVTGVMQCWYFGNYPSMMSKAAGELAFLERYDDEDAFLTSLAGIYWGKSLAPEVVRAWKCFERAYRAYPMNVMFSYYGPVHDGVVWKLSLEPKNNKLPRTWQTLDPIDGDRIGEALLQGHTLGEALTLLTQMCEGWREGIAALPAVPRENADAWEQRSVALTIGTLFESARNILEFYHLRDCVGRRDGDVSVMLCRMEALVRAEIENSTRMIGLSAADPRLGYHSEGEGYKFFPEKLRDRIAQLEALLETEFPRVRERIAQGLPPLAYYTGEGEGKKYRLSRDIADAAWEPVGNASFRGAVDDGILTLELAAPSPTEWRICPEFRLLWPEPVIRLSQDGGVTLRHGIDAQFYNSLFGEKIDAALAPYRDITPIDGGYRLRIPLDAFGTDGTIPMKLRLVAGGSSWCIDPDAMETLGLGDIRPAEYGWLLPPQ